MIKVSNNLFVGTTSDCFYDNRKGHSVIHACKTPCHQRKLNYSGSLPPTHTNYLIFEEDNQLYLNIVDSDRIYTKFADPMFFKALEFIEANIHDKKIIVHCNLGQSRSPGIALVYMAKKGLIPKTSYIDAVSAFRVIYPGFNPGKGINAYLQQNWNRLVN